MKSNLLIALLLSCTETYAGSPKIQVPELSMDHVSLKVDQASSLQEKFFEKKLAHKPDYSVNSWLGNFETSFRIDLPKNDFLKNGLWFDYNSSQILNIGYGTGFSLRLPRLILKKNKLFFNSSNELIETSLKLDIADRVKRLENALNRKIQILKTFRLKDESDFSLFIKTSDGFLQLTLEGENNVYDRDGLLIAKVALNNKILQFVYNDQRLSKIVSPSEHWSVLLDYKESEAQAKYINGRFTLVPRGLNGILVQQNQSTRRYSFTYKDDLLTSVKKEGALHDIFVATYQIQAGKYSQNSINGSSLAEKNIVFKKRDKTPDFVDFVQNSEKQIIETDLNGDFITDEVTFEQSASSNDIKKKYKELFSKAYTISCDERCYQDIDAGIFNNAKILFEQYLNSQTMNINVKFGKLNGESYELEVDPSLQLKLAITDLGRFAVMGSEEADINFEQIRIPRFIDINNDGKKDLILVSDKAERSFVEKNKKQDILTQSVFNLINNPKEDNIFNYEGENPLIYLFKTNEELLAKIVISNDKEIYHITNVSYWEKIQSQFKMNSLSTLIDYNRDGINDILTGKTIFLLGENGEAQTEQLSDDQIQKIFDISNLTKEALSKERYSLIDVNGNGIYKPFLANNYYVQPTDRKLHILSDDKDIVLERPSDTPLLISLKSTYGGTVEVQYGYVDGAYVVKKIIHEVNDESQPNWEERFSYEGSRWHIQKNILLGFKKGIIEKKMLNDETTTKRVVEFDLDDQYGPLLNIGRARKAGRVLSEKLTGANGTESETINKYADHMFSGSRSFSFLLSQSIKEKGKADLKIIQDFPRFIDDIPLTIREQRLSGKNKQLTIVDKIQIQGMYLSRDLSRTIFNQSNQKRVVEKNTWNITGQLIQHQTPAGIETFSYDTFGRIIHYQTDNGKKHSYSYKENLPLVQTATIDDLNTTYTYSDIENDIVQMQIEGTSEVYSFEYTTDGVLSKMAKNNQQLFSQSRLGKKLFESRILDEKFQIQTDGYGRISSKTKLGVSNNLILFKKTFDDRDRVTLESSPYFEESTSPWVLTERKFDALGEVIREAQSDDSGALLTEFKLAKDVCATKETETGFRSILCLNGNGDAISQSIPNEKSVFEYGFTGEVSAITPFGHTYVRNLNGDIVESFSSGWGKYSRNFDYKNNSVSYDDGTIVSQTPYGEGQNYTNGLQGNVFVKAGATYDKRLLTRFDLTLGSQNFNHHFRYDSSRNLIAKTEFHTTWSYELDSFGRIQTEKISDAKNNYILQYYRSEGQVTEIAPHITHIEYSSRIKPILVEYANGLSAEYEYGPRGELLSYSLTNGMKVFYHAKYQYRSDLKLLNQTVITNLKLDKQIQNFSYDDLFEVSQKASLRGTGRNQMGLVPSLGGLDFSYHHLNLVQIKGSNILANYYGDSNRFIGTCDQTNNCFFKISPTEVEYKGELQKLIEVGGMPVGLLYKGAFYPVIPDHKLAVIGLMNADGAKIGFVRSFDEWGNLKDVLGDRYLEKTIAFSYSRLLQNPVVETMTKEKLYFSDTRVYSPMLGEWMSPDSTVVWSPEKLVSMPGNWNPVKYANNDPVNFLDESGNFANLIAGGLIGFSAGAIVSASQNQSWLKGGVVGGLTGIAIASGAYLAAPIANALIQSSVVSITSFTSSVIVQKLINGRIDIVESVGVAITGPLAFSYGKLFSGVSSSFLREFTSGMSFMSVDLFTSFVSSKFTQNSQASTSDLGAYNKFHFDNYKFNKAD